MSTPSAPALSRGAWRCRKRAPGVPAMDSIPKATYSRLPASRPLHRYWFVGDAKEPFGVSGIGVTALTEHEARRILEQALPTFAGREQSPWRLRATSFRTW